MLISNANSCYKTGMGAQNPEPQTMGHNLLSWYFSAISSAEDLLLIKMYQTSLYLEYK